MADQSYPIVVMRNADGEGGGFCAYAPDLRGCMSDGETPEEAVGNCVQAVAEWLEEAVLQGRPIPAPYSLARQAHQDTEFLLNELREQAETRRMLDAELDALKVKIKALSDRLDDPGAWFAAPYAVSRVLVPEDQVH